ncbi:MAG: glycosyltransferase family 4 protein [Rhodospirillales bacterium]|nr:glycosyltransferase family 4 protein [Rhodospirillales bacterium]
MRVIIVGSKFWPEYAGSSNRIFNTYKRLSENQRDLDISIITGSTEFNWPTRYKWQGYRVVRLACPIPRLRGLIGRILLALEQYLVAGMAILALTCRQRPDVIHVYGTSSAVAMAILWASVWRIPLMIELVTDGARPWQQLPGLRYRSSLRLDKGTVITAISEQLAEACAEQYLTDNVWARPNPVDLERFYPVDQATRNAIRTKISPFKEGDIVLVAVAKIMPQKNQIFLISVLPHLPERYKLLLAGPLVKQGPLAARDMGCFEEMQCEIERQGLSNRCHIQTGFVNTADYVKASDVYLMPSMQEGLGTPMLESLACAVPVVANADVPAFTQWINQGENGFLCKLNPFVWSQAVVLASELSPEARHLAAERVGVLSGAASIDESFLKLMKHLSENNVESPISVHSILERNAG